MKKTYIILTILLSIVLYSCKSDNDYKTYIINNVNSFEKISDSSFVLENLKGYHTEITISFLKDSSYTIIFWGDRNSCMWSLRKDKMINISIPYNKYKNENINLDLLIMNKFKRK